MEMGKDVDATSVRRHDRSVQKRREHGSPGSCALNYEKRPGTFVCAGCGQPLFVSKKKFESGTGWPSFNDPVAGAVETSEDRSYGMIRTEALL
jgi:peptide-methionine (R)-S-oxide reductase